MFRLRSQDGSVFILFNDIFFLHMFLVIFFQLMFHLLFTKMNVTIQIKDHEILIIITKEIDIAFFFCYE